VKRFLAILLAVLVVFSIAACGSKAPEAEAPSETPQQEETTNEGDIVIGVLQDITGVTSTLGKMVQEGHSGQQMKLTPLVV